ncbi:MAG: heme ABC exporter ATP-binding protein CcmA [Dehalococcoidia bacterium]
MSPTEAREVAAVKLEGIGKRFGRTNALRGLDLEVWPGERLAVFGPNGSGKTTLLRVLAGLTRPTKGRLLIYGMEYRSHGQALRRRIGVVGHHPYLYDDLSAEENLQFYGRMFGLDEVPRKVDEALRRVGMERRRRDRVRTLSRGMQQRLAIARAILHDPDLLLMDEPDTGLDQEASARIGDFLEKEQGGRRTVILTTHNLRLGLQHCDRFVILAGGRAAHQGSHAGQDLAKLEELYWSHGAAA